MKTTEEKNRMIAEFMGVESYYVDTSGNIWTENTSKRNDFESDLIRLEFHTSWDWLMPVVEKIESFEDENRCAKYNFNSVQCFIEIVDNHTSEEIVVVDCDNKFDSTYNAVVQFIEWYNENK